MATKKRPLKPQAPEAEAERQRARHPIGRRQTTDRQGQGARLHHLRRAERRPAAGPEQFRADRGHHGDAQRNGHAGRRERGGRGPRGRRPAAEEEADRGRRGAGRQYQRKLGRAPMTRCACICAKWARVELLSREGEIAIAKRIEAGRDMMIRGLCESPLTFRAIIAWHEALKTGRVLLRDVIDLEAMQAGNATRSRSRAMVPRSFRGRRRSRMTRRTRASACRSRRSRRS